MERLPGELEILRSQFLAFHDQLPCREPGPGNRATTERRLSGRREGRRVRVRQVWLGDGSCGKPDRALGATTREVKPDRCEVRMNELPSIRTARLQLRPLTVADAPRVEELVSDPEVALTTATIPHPYPEGAAVDWIERHSQGPDFGGEAVW